MALQQAQLEYNATASPIPQNPYAAPIPIPIPQKIFASAAAFTQAENDNGGSS
jgi:hypothetical protein